MENCELTTLLVSINVIQSITRHPNFCSLLVFIVKRICSIRFYVYIFVNKLLFTQSASHCNGIPITFPALRKIAYIVYVNITKSVKRKLFRNDNIICVRLCKRRCDIALYEKDTIWGATSVGGIDIFKPPVI